MAEILFERPGGGTVVISVDAMIEENHQSSSLITEHAVELGSNVSDHVRPENDRISMSFMVSNTPVKQPGDFFTDGAEGEIQPLNIFLETAPRRADGNPRILTPFAGGQFAGFGLKTKPAPEKPAIEPQPLIAGSVQGTESGANVLQWSQEFDRVRAIYDVLRALVLTGTLVQIITSLRTYEDMVLNNLSAPRSAGSGNAITFSSDAVQVRLVSTETVAAPEETRGDQAGRLGGQGTEETAATEESRASLLHNLFFG